MSENGELKKEEKKENSGLKLIVTIPESGGVSVEAPGNGEFFDEMRCFYLLKKAEQYIISHNAEASRSKIVQANKPGGIMNFAKNRFKK